LPPSGEYEDFGSTTQFSGFASTLKLRG